MKPKLSREIMQAVGLARDLIGLGVDMYRASSITEARDDVQTLREQHRDLRNRERLRTLLARLREGERS